MQHSLFGQGRNVYLSLALKPHEYGLFNVLFMSFSLLFGVETINVA